MAGTDSVKRSSTRFTPPTLRHHKASGQAFVQVKGKRYYLGKHNSPDSRRAYEKIVGQLRRGRVPSLPSKRAIRTPSIRVHRATGQAIVELNGRTYYLGKFGSVEAQRRGEQLIAQWLQNGRTLPDTVSVTLPASDDGITICAVSVGIGVNCR